MLHLQPLDVAYGPLSLRPRRPMSTSRISSGSHPKPFPAGCVGSDAAQVDPWDADGNGGDPAPCELSYLCPSFLALISVREEAFISIHNFPAGSCRVCSSRSLCSLVVFYDEKLRDWSKGPIAEIKCDQYVLTSYQ